MPLRSLPVDVGQNGSALQAGNSRELSMESNPFCEQPFSSFLGWVASLTIRLASSANRPRRQPEFKAEVRIRARRAYFTIDCCVQTNIADGLRS